jgi:hypothetical protein
MKMREIPEIPKEDRDKLNLGHDSDTIELSRLEIIVCMIIGISIFLLFVITG